MSIKQRLLLSNLGMIILPVLLFLIMETGLSYLFFYVWGANPEGEQLQTFMTYRTIGIVFILVLSNGVLTFVVSRTIITPVKKLNDAAYQIGKGNLNAKIERERRDEIGELAESFEHMRKKLKESQYIQQQYENNRKEYVARISHDLKTPLTSVQGYLRGLLDGVADTEEKRQRYLKIAYEKSEDLNQLISQLSLYSKLDLDQVEFQLEQLDLRSLLTDVLEDFKFHKQLKEGQAVLEWTKPCPFTVKGDRSQLGRVFMNLLENSHKYKGADPLELKITLSSLGDEVQVDFTDNGKGIPEKSLPFIFDSFYRAETSRNSETGGSGLGLAIVKKIVEQHKGQVKVHSEHNKTTTVTVTIPKWKENPDAEGTDY